MHAHPMGRNLRSHCRQHKKRIYKGDRLSKTIRSNYEATSTGEEQHRTSRRTLREIDGQEEQEEKDTSVMNDQSIRGFVIGLIIDQEWPRYLRIGLPPGASDKL